MLRPEGQGGERACHAQGLGEIPPTADPACAEALGPREASVTGARLMDGERHEVKPGGQQGLRHGGPYRPG